MSNTTSTSGLSSKVSNALSELEAACNHLRDAISEKREADRKVAACTNAVGKARSSLQLAQRDVEKHVDELAQELSL